MLDAMYLIPLELFMMETGWLSAWTLYFNTLKKAEESSLPGCDCDAEWIMPWPWLWRHYDPSQCLAQRQSFTTQNISLYGNTTARTSNFTLYFWFLTPNPCPHF